MGFCFLIGSIKRTERIGNIRCCFFIILFCGIIRKIEGNRDSGLFDLVEFILCKRIISTVYHVKTFHVFQVKPIQNIWCFSADAAFIKIQELTVSVF